MVHAVVRDLPGGQWKVDLNSPDVSIVVEIIRNVCCVGIVKNFFDKRKYNLVNLVDKTDTAEKESQDIRQDIKDEIKDEKGTEDGIKDQKDLEDEIKNEEETR